MDDSKADFSPNLPLPRWVGKILVFIVYPIFIMHFVVQMLARHTQNKAAGAIYSIMDEVLFVGMFLLPSVLLLGWGCQTRNRSNKYLWYIAAFLTFIMPAFLLFGRS